jgi:hypothetical protein
VAARTDKDGSSWWVYIKISGRGIDTGMDENLA